MILFRIINPSYLLFNKFHQSAVYSALVVKKLGATPSVSFSSFYVSKGSVDTINKLTLTPVSPLVFSSRGLKVRGNLDLRCKDCYLVRKDGVMYVECSSYPRHKQRAMMKRPKYTWILTHAFQSKYRPY